MSGRINHNIHGNVPCLCLFYSSQTGIWCSRLAAVDFPSGKEKTLLLSHKLGKEIHKQGKQHIGHKKEIKIAKLQADLHTMSQIKTNSQTFPRTRREQEEKDAGMQCGAHNWKQLQNNRYMGPWRSWDGGSFTLG